MGEERPADPEEDLDVATPPEDEPDDDDVDVPPEELEAEPPPEEEERETRRDTRRRRLEKLVPDLLKRAIERGIEAGLNSLGPAGKGSKSAGKGPAPTGGSDTLPPPAKEPATKEAHRELASVPKEIAGYVFSQIDDTKNAMVRVVAREVREFLEAADLATELQKALTMLSFEIRTEIRFIPNDSGGIKPDVKAAISPKHAGKSRPAGRRPTALADEDDDT